MNFNLLSIIEKCKTIYNNKYGYSLINLNSSSEDFVDIICPLHGIFQQTLNSHIIETGCKKCNNINIKISRKTNQEDFLKRAIEIHHNFYNYNKTIYTLSNSKITITCPVHGDFEQIANDHLQGCGCPKCSKEKNKKYHSENSFGWNYTNWEKKALKSKQFDSYKVYIIECWNETERFIKIGRTYRTVKNRFLSKKVMPYNYNILKEFVFDNARKCCEYEVELKRKYKNYKYFPNIGFDGVNECFKMEIIND